MAEIIQNEKGFKILRVTIPEIIFMPGELEWYNSTEDKWECTAHKYRIKPKSDYILEIEALQAKAKQNGMKAVINFEKLEE